MTDDGTLSVAIVGSGVISATTTPGAIAAPPAAADHRRRRPRPGGATTARRPGSRTAPDRRPPTFGSLDRGARGRTRRPRRHLHAERHRTRELAEEALAAGTHVVIEKPLDASLPAARRLAALATAAEATRAGRAR